MAAGLYIHIPYCHAKCAYCDFYSMPDASTAPALVDALVAEARLRGNEISERVTTVYIGGGTPSSIGPEMLTSLIHCLEGEIDLSNVAEFTVEVNPEDVNAELLQSLRSAGVNRVSMGVQSLVDSELRAVGRRHTAAEAVRAARLVSDYFDNYSLDLIFGLPGQTMASLEKSLDTLIALGAPHLSAYLLSYEQGTRLYAMMMAGKIEEASEELCEAMYRLVDRRLADAGYRHYEISNYARPGMESRHNSNYWNSTPYLGLGPSAHSFDGNVRRFNPHSVRMYIDALLNGRTCFEEEPESLEDKCNDYVMTRLRTAEGIDFDDLEHRPFGTFAPAISGAMQRFVDGGQLVVSGRRVYIPSTRWLTADAIIRELFI